MTGDGRVTFTVTQRQRLRELGALPAETETAFTDAASRDLLFKELERRLTTDGRRRLNALREGLRVPALCALADSLRAAGGTGRGDAPSCKAIRALLVSVSRSLADSPRSSSDMESSKIVSSAV